MGSASRELYVGRLQIQKDVQDMEVDSINLAEEVGDVESPASINEETPANEENELPVPQPKLKKFFKHFLLLFLYSRLFITGICGLVSLVVLSMYLSS